MTSHSIGIYSLAVSFPSMIRTNAYWCEKFPNMVVQDQPKRVRVSRIPQSPFSDQESNIWSQEVVPYLNDPFRGNVERRVIDSDESSLTIEIRAAQDALRAADLCPDQVELVVASSLFSEQVGYGNAAYLARQLELSCPAWNLESTCSSALVALQNAHLLVQSEEYRNVLVVVSQIGSRTVDEADTLSWSMGDGAGAFVVSSLKPNQGILSTHIISTAATCGAYSHELITNEGVPQMRTRTGENASMVAETAVEFVRNCCKEAVAKVGMRLDQIDFFAFNTPAAWSASVCTRALGIDPERTINLYPRYANIGPVLPIANLYHAAQSGRLRENDLVLVYTNGAGATAAAAVMRWGDVALGTIPAPPLSVNPEQETVHWAGAISHSAVSDSTESSVAIESVPELKNLSRETLVACKPEQRQKMLEAYLSGWLASALQVPLGQLTPQQPFASLLDSLMALTFRSRIESDLQVQVSMSQFFGEHTIAQLAEQLLSSLALANLVVAEPNAAVGKQEAERERLSL